MFLYCIMCDFLILNAVIIIPIYIFGYLLYINTIILLVYKNNIVILKSR